MANNYISLKQIADKVLRNPVMAGISFEAIIDYAVDFMRIVQCGGFFENKCVPIEIQEHQGLLPEDFFEMIQVRLGTAVTEDGELTVSKAFRYATDTFHLSGYSNYFDMTYKIQGGHIFTSIKEGVIEISYKAILIDDEGFPLIPDNSKFTRALEAYIKLQWFTILFEMGKLQQAVYQNAQQMYAWAVGACESEFQKMSLDKAESFFNSWRSLIPRANEHYTTYNTLGSRQNLKFN